MVLTLIRAIQNWRINQSRLYVVLVNHNILCMRFSALGNEHLRIAAPPGLLPILFFNFQFTILAILATRMHLHLWQVNQHPHGSTSVLVHIPTSDISFANSTA
ncbi:uncharacterized protein F5891DRAFT_1193668 [Suillus fuscotomentosus]|uniref:Uncharacterized protein n=1 Tax=Suillus fuscotomentosus TaxID=1912939 RepID=A0AAD4DXD1_9AGAM|nr:uncharacterized protein F5891DRAFT_1193668 [Suillus fuscotomentosus]KAG1895854.1 hypothetical protein F5891DRAFT_1193668 [Suillus fuscotomentosus]